MKRPKQKAWKPAEHSARKGPGAQERRNRGGAWIAGGLLPAEAIYEPRRLEFGSLSPGNATQCVFLKHGNRLPPPLFILAPPRSFTSLVCAMLGQHPQMYGLPETHLFCDETLASRAERVAQETYPMDHGLLRAVAQLFFGGQTEATIRKAKQWLRLRSQLRTDLIFRILADKVYPLILVDKSPSIIYDVKVLRHLQESFPRARFIHLSRHPRGHGESVMRYIQERSKYGPIPPTHWLLEIVSYPPHTPEEGAKGSHALDPQYGWYALNKNICDFLISVPGGQKMQIRGEDLLTKPAVGLPDCHLVGAPNWRPGNPANDAPGAVSLCLSWTSRGTLWQ